MSSHRNKLFYLFSFEFVIKGALFDFLVKSGQNFFFVFMHKTDIKEVHCITHSSKSLNGRYIRLLASFCLHLWWPMVDPSRRNSKKYLKKDYIQTFTILLTCCLRNIWSLNLITIEYIYIFHYQLINNQISKPQEGGVEMLSCCYFIHYYIIYHLICVFHLGQI